MAPELTVTTEVKEVRRTETREEMGPRRRVKRLFTERGEWLDRVFEGAGPWKRRDARIEGKGGVVFEQTGVEAPENWSQMAVNVVASKYLRGRLGTPEREDSVRGLIERVVRTIADWGLADGYFEVGEDRGAFEAELAHLLVTQRAAFNSPVWFNVGVEERPQCSACFINHVKDTMESILDLAKTEGMIFKYGSGAGVNLSNLRGREEQLSTGGTASGPISFMKGYDAFAGVIKSGGRTRRAAKIVSLNVDHPDIVEFVKCKRAEEEKARALVRAGYGEGIDGEAYASVFFQNANHSIRVTDAFMRAADAGERWPLIARKTGEEVGEVNARELLDLIAETSHACGDPGLQFDDAANRWHTCPTDGRINASNPCSEFMFLDESACNLASINLLKFLDSGGGFLIDHFTHAVETLILAQEILVDRASYPTKGIHENSRTFRPLGLGYANLGATLMARGLPYDSEAGREFAAGVTALMTGVAYRRAAEIAAVKGPFVGYAANAAAMRGVIDRHRTAIQEEYALAPVDLVVRAREAWDEAVELGGEHGFRNAQTTLLAPTGTIAFMMDCDTTGIEPDLALLKTKKLVGGGEMTYENRAVDRALLRLGYPVGDMKRAVRQLRETGRLDGVVREEHLPVFDCALPDTAGRSIPWEGHVRMLGAVQPFLSGSISKTVNLPADATVEDVKAVYDLSWHLGLKSIAIYRDGSKESQPLETKVKKKNGNGNKRTLDLAWTPPEKVIGRRKLPGTRRSLTHKIDVAGHEGYVTAGMHDDGRLGEIFVVMAKTGSTVSGLLDAWATSTSIALQYGAPFEVLKEKFVRTRFEPAGYSSNQEIGLTTSVLDYIFRWLEIEFPDGVRRGERTPSIEVEEVPSNRHRHVSGPPCSNCGSIMEPNGACHRCPTCGTTNGCG